MADTRRRKTPPPPRTPGLSDLVQGPLDALARFSGIDRATRSLERLGASAERAAEILDSLDTARFERLVDAAERAAKILDHIDAERLDRLATSAERAAAMLDRLEKELGVEGAVRSLRQVEALSRTTEEMNQSLKAIERFLVDTRAVLEPFERLPLPRAFRRGRQRGGEQAPE
ncbi:MAG TPA: hypothetical protein VJQ84_07650 [Solirubrobacterales bacterium]|nr:hypothetical protein [Solirubrobacterales bacterium]